MTFCMSAGILGQIPVYEAETAAEEKAIKTAAEKEFNTDYSITQESDAEQCWNKITLKESGIVGLNFTKAENKTLGIIAMDVFVYNEKENCISKIREEEGEVEGKVYIGLGKGTYYIKISNYGNKQYKYTVKVSNVTPKATSLTSLKAGNDAFTAKWKKASCSGYRIQYSTSKSFKNAKTVKISFGKTSTTVKKLSSGKKYYVRIRTYTKAGKKCAYSSWPAARSVTTK